MEMTKAQSMSAPDFRADFGGRRPILDLPEPRAETAWQTLCALIGEDKATKFCRAFVKNYNKLRISRAKFFVFADVIGAQAAKRIVDTFDGELVSLPRRVKDETALRQRDAAIRLLGSVEKSQAETARSLGLSTRQIRRIRACGHFEQEKTAHERRSR